MDGKVKYLSIISFPFWGPPVLLSSPSSPLLHPLYFPFQFVIASASPVFWLFHITILFSVFPSSRSSSLLLLFYDHRCSQYRKSRQYMTICAAPEGASEIFYPSVECKTQDQVREWVNLVALEVWQSSLAILGACWTRRVDKPFFLGISFILFFSFGDSIKEPKDVFLAQRKLL